MNIEVDRTKCTGLGICESIAPDFFEVDDDGDLVLLENAFGSDRLPDLEQAVEGCPTAALRLVR